MLNAPRRRLAALLSLGLIVGGTAALGIAAPASADDALQLSLDGRHWSTMLTDTVFPRGSTLIPGSSLDGTFFIRNASGGPAWVRVGVSSLTVTSPELAIGMNLTTIGTTSDSASGTTSRLSAGDIVCTDILARATPLPAGGIVRVDASLAFRMSVSGSTAQQEAAQVDFIAELSDANLNSMSVPLCNGTTTIGPVDPAPPGGGGGGSTGGSGGTNGNAGSGTGGTGTGTGSGTGGTGSGSDSGSGAAPDGSNAGGDVAQQSTIGSIGGGSFEVGLDEDIPFNTVHWSEEYAILVLVIAALVGAIGRLIAQRRWVDHDQRMGGV
jgi:hypothetical protein